jgi:adenylosuccinate synthase
MKIQAVIGLGFGDEGKGKVVSALAALSVRALVIRYCGGQQAGHHVVRLDGSDHVFSNFGSGTLQGHSSCWMPYCTVDPVGLMNELDDLHAKGVRPTLFIHRDCPITTPYEKVYNRLADKNNKHGSCGVGVGQTIQRQEDHFSIVAEDMLHPAVLRIKLKMLREHYYFQGNDINTEEFFGACQEVTRANGIIITGAFPAKTFDYDTVIFEGSQGILLDQEIGFFPHVTRSSTGTANIRRMGFDPEIFLVTRAYQTRHGNGPMTNETELFNVPINPYENNTSTGFQGEFRRTIMDLDLLKYAIRRDRGLRDNPKLSLVITCLDLMPGQYKLTRAGQVFTFETEQEFVEEIRHTLAIPKVYLSRSPHPVLEQFGE